MIVDETNPATPEADSAMPEAASLTRVAVKRRKSADGSESAKKSRKLGDSAGGAKLVKRGRKSAIMFDDSVAATRPVQFDPSVANGATDHAMEHMADAPPPAGELAALTMPPSVLAEDLAPEPAMPALAEIASEPSITEEPAQPEHEPAPLEMSVPVVEFSELPMPLDVEIEFLPNPEPMSEFAADEPQDSSSDELTAFDEPPPETVAEAPLPSWPTAAPEAQVAPVPEMSASEAPSAEAAPEFVSEAAAAVTDEISESDEQAAQKSPASRFEAIARAARMSALSSSKPGIARTIAVDAARSAEKQKRTTEIFGYWVRAKNGRRFPSRSDFEIAKVAEFWPNSMLLTCDEGTPAVGSHISFSKVMRLDNGNEGNGGEFNFTSMIIEWILTIGGEAARVGQPVQDTEVFPSTDGTHAYKIVALPLSDHQTQVDHVLCHLTRS